MSTLNSKLLFTIIAVFLLVSCNTKQPKDPIITVDHNTSESLLKNNEEELKALSQSLELSEEEYQDLLVKNEKTISKNQFYYRKIHLLQSELDSLQSVNNVLNSRLDDLISTPAPSISPYEQNLVSMVHRMHADWKSLPKEKDIDAILQYFLPEFMVSQVAIDATNKGHLANYNKDEYTKHLKSITNQKGYSYEFGNVHFLDIEIKEQEFFNIAYKCSMRRYKDDQRMNTNSILVTMTGKKVDGEWKIAHYSLVNFQYQAFQNVTL